MPIQVLSNRKVRKSEPRNKEYKHCKVNIFVSLIILKYIITWKIFFFIMFAWGKKKKNKSCHFLFAFTYTQLFWKGALWCTLKGIRRICSAGSKFFPLRAGPTRKGIKILELAPLKSINFSLTKRKCLGHLKRKMLFFPGLR